MRRGRRTRARRRSTYGSHVGGRHGSTIDRAPIRTHAPAFSTDRRIRAVLIGDHVRTLLEWYYQLMVSIDDQIQSDIETIIEDDAALGDGKADPRDILERIRDQPADYLEAFETLFLGMRFDALAHSKLDLAAFLQVVQESAPRAVRERVEEVASWLLKQYEAVLLIYEEAESGRTVLALVPDETARIVRRLHDRCFDLKRLVDEEQ